MRWQQKAALYYYLFGGTLSLLYALIMAHWRIPFFPGFPTGVLLGLVFAHFVPRPPYR